MHHHLQDIILAICILGFNIALLPSIVSKHKPHAGTGIITAFFQLVAFGVFINLSLWYSAAMSFLNAALWVVLVVQKLTNPKQRKKSKN